MSSSVDQQKVLTDDGNSEMSARRETSCLKTTESSDCQSPGIISDNPEIDSEPRHEDQCRDESIPTAPIAQEVSKRQTNDVQALGDEASDCAPLLDGHCSRSNGEGCFDNENACQDEDVLPPLAETGSTLHCENTEEKPSKCFDSYEDSEKAMESRTNVVQPQPEIILQPLSLRAVYLSAGPGSKEGPGTNSDSSVRFMKPTGTGERIDSSAQYGGEDRGDDRLSRLIKPSCAGEYQSHSSEHGRAEIETGPPLSDCSIKPTGTREHTILTPQHGGSKIGADSPLSVHSVKFISSREYLSPSAQQGRAELGIDPPGSVRFIKPTATGQQSSRTSERGTENREIFERGGDQGRHPPEGTSYSGPGLEEIEQLSVREIPEPQIVMSPISSVETPSVNYCLLAMALLCRCLKATRKRTCWQFAKYPLFYLASTLVMMTCIIVADNIVTDRDIPLTVLASVGSFVIITLLADRAQFAHVHFNRKSFVTECRQGCRKSETCIPWCCCRPPPESSPERHSHYRHLEEDGAFRHEIADVSRLDPRDCPQIKMVELRGNDHEDSPDCPPEVSQVNADVHVGKREGERLGAIRKHPVRTAKPHKTRSDRSRPVPPKIFSADIHAAIEPSPPELSPIQETALDHNDEGQPRNSEVGGTRTKEAPRKKSKNLEDDASTNGEDIDENEYPRSTTDSPIFPGGADFKKFSDCSPTLPRFSKIRQSVCLQADDVESTSLEEGSFPVDEFQVCPDAGEFMCEHYGQSVACSCAALLKEAVQNIVK